MSVIDKNGDTWSYVSNGETMVWINRRTEEKSPVYPPQEGHYTRVQRFGGFVFWLGVIMAAVGIGASWGWPAMLLALGCLHILIGFAMIASK
jgi:hypothetical protein